MDNLPVIEINAAERILRWKDALSGGVFTGTDKIRSGYGNGDCLYFDFHHRVFAVADSTERFPGASRDILHRLSEVLTQFGVPRTAAEWKTLINHKIYPEQKYQHKTTFSCVAVTVDNDETTLTIAHGGDSKVLVVDSVNGDVLFQTNRNMVFAGRSREITDVVEYRRTDSGIRVVMHSDGFDDLSRFCIQQSFLSRISDVFISRPIDCICEQIHCFLEKNDGLFEHDDIAVIIMDPFRLPYAQKKRVLIGGTKPHEEKRFRAERENSDLSLWTPNVEWETAAEAFLKSGILILEH